MNNVSKIVLGAALLLLATGSAAQTETSDRDDLRMTALEALITAPPERAFPIVDKVLSGNHNMELKERALFILSQMETPEAQAKLLTFANGSEGGLQTEAIRMIGIGGDKDAIASLGELYEGGSADVREAVLEAYLIADDTAAVFNIAANTDNADEFAEAVQMLGAMGANAELRELRSRAGLSESLIEAYAISGDAESLRELAMDSSNPEMQERAIEALGIVGGDAVNQTLMEIYGSSSSDDVRDAALEGLLISGHDGGVLELYRSSADAGEKRRLLEYLVMMDSEAVWDLIDNALDGSQ